MEFTNNNLHTDETSVYSNLYTYDEAAERLARHPNTIANMVKRKELEQKKIGRTPYVFKDEVEAFGKRNGK